MCAFLVSTTHHLLAIDPDGEVLWRVHSGKGLYFGIAVGPDARIYVGCRNSTLGPEDESIRASERGSVLVLDTGLQVCDELVAPFPLRDVHGMEYFDDRLWITCAFDNMIAIYRLGTCEWSRWYPAPHPAHRDRDVHHINTVRFLGEHAWLVAHQFGPSQLLAYDYPSLDLQFSLPLGSMAHDIFLLNGVVATCSSADGWIVNSKGERLRTGNFPRGMAIAGRGNLLGMSLHAVRSERAHQSGILRWYTSDWHHRVDYLLPGVGMVLDVRELDDARYKWEGLERWPLAEITPGEYNRLAPGNNYCANEFKRCQKMTLEWHDGEQTHCWTAARDASVPILISPGETRLRVEASSALPAHYWTEVWLDGNRLGEIVFEAPGVHQRDFCVRHAGAGEHKLTFRVPFLWKPCERIPKNQDERALGVAVHSITLLPANPEPIEP